MVWSSMFHAMGNHENPHDYSWNIDMIGQNREELEDWWVLMTIAHAQFFRGVTIAHMVEPRDIASMGVVQYWRHVMGCHGNYQPASVSHESKQVQMWDALKHLEIENIWNVWRIFAKIVIDYDNACPHVQRALKMLLIASLTPIYAIAGSPRIQSSIFDSSRQMSK